MSLAEIVQNSKRLRERKTDEQTERYLQASSTRLRRDIANLKAQLATNDRLLKERGL